jgi:hypothetical protein
MSFNGAGELIRIVESLVYGILNNNKLLTGQWQLGQVEEVISDKSLKVYVNGSDVAQTIPCNPDVTFNVGDHVWVIFINGNGRDKFVLCKRGV